jgi:hypothetical protein
MPENTNKTGAAAKPEMLAQMLAAAAEFPPTSVGSPFAAHAVRIAYAREVEPGSLGYGSIPGPTPSLLIDKLGERLAFERIGVRAYEILISKHEAFGSYEGGPTRAQLEQLLNDEHCHFSLLFTASGELGADPSALTPSANLGGVIARGMVQVLSDPRTTLIQGLETAYIGELADTAGWGALIEIARMAGHERLVEAFIEAEQTEERHTELIEGWLAAALQLHG